METHELAKKFVDIILEYIDNDIQQLPAGQFKRGQLIAIQNIVRKFNNICVSEQIKIQRNSKLKNIR